MIVVESEESFRRKHYDTVVDADDASCLTSPGPMSFLAGQKGGDVRSRGGNSQIMTFGAETHLAQGAE